MKPKDEKDDADPELACELGCPGVNALRALPDNDAGRASREV